ncbi:MAG: acyl carrier protein [Alphaproteobacteria bacterium]|nr:acyl carrier protein [Alphaproteobacteria bacterium]
MIQEALADVAPNRAGEFNDITVSTTIESLGLDSIATMEMVGFLEERVDTTFPDEELTAVSTIGHLANLIRTGKAA